MLFRYEGYYLKFAYFFINLINYSTVSYLTKSSVSNTIIRITSKTRFYLALTVPEIGNDGKIQVYSIIGCKYCRQAKSQLNQLGLKFENVDIETTDKNSLNFIGYQRLQHAKKNTVPQIYFEQERIGGYDDLMKVISDGALFSKLKNNRISISEPIQITFDADTNGLLDSISQDKTQDKIPAHETITTTTKIPYLNYYVETTKSNQPQNTDINALELSVQLDRLSRQLLDSFSTVSGDRINYHAMKSSDLFHQYIKKSQKMADVTLTPLAALPEPSRLSFFINLYNCLIIHAYSSIGPPEDNPTARSSFFNGSTGAAYNISGLLFSPDDIEHGILRANAPHPSSMSTSPATATTYFPPGDVRSILSLSKLDPRIHFALNCGAVSCPPIKTFGTDPEEALARAASTYLTSEIHFDVQSHTLYLPKICLWYAKDFGKTEREQLETILRMLPRVKIEEINERYASSSDTHLSSSWNPSMTTKEVLTTTIDEEKTSSTITSSSSSSSSLYNIAYNQYNWNVNQL